mgnify:CR=1 FL=1
MTVELVYRRFEKVFRVHRDCSAHCVEWLHSFGFSYDDIDLMLDTYERNKRE